MSDFSCGIIAVAMRTTLTIDDDVAFGLRKLQEKDHDKSFKEIVNEVLRRGLGAPKPKKKVKVKTFSMGLREGISLDNIEELLDQVEGPFRR